MIRRDYLMRQLTLLIQALIALILKKKMVVSDLEEEQDYVKYGSSLLGLGKNELFVMSADQLIDLFSPQDYSLEKLEAAAYLLLLDQNSRTINHDDTVKKLLEYINEHSATFSLDRQAILDSL